MLTVKFLSGGSDTIGRVRSQMQNKHTSSSIPFFLSREGCVFLLSSFCLLVQSMRFHHDVLTRVSYSVLSWSPSPRPPLTPCSLCLPLYFPFLCILLPYFLLLLRLLSSPSSFTISEDVNKHTHIHVCTHM